MGSKLYSEILPINEKAACVGCFAAHEKGVESASILRSPTDVSKLWVFCLVVRDLLREFPRKLIVS